MRGDLVVTRMATSSLHRLLTPMLRLTRLIAFVCAYVALDWASFLHPLHGLNITLWNPAPAFGLVLWLRFGRWTAVPWFLSLMLGDLIIRGMPAGLLSTVMLSTALTAGYGAIGEVLRRRLRGGEVFGDRIHLLTWLGIVVVGTLLNSLLYIAILSLIGLLPFRDSIEGLIRFWVGDCVGVLVSMPMLWMLLTGSGQVRLRSLLRSWETTGYATLAVIMLWVNFRNGPSAEFQYFYFLFLPVVWAAARQGLSGAAVSAFILQAGIIFAVEWLSLVAVTVMEFQMLGAVLALVGFFIGVLVDEQRLAVEKLKRTLHLAAAGEMAAALAHELNQPMTALAGYGNACEHLLAKGETGDVLRDAIRRMVAESGRAAEVVRRVRDFFRTGATRLEPVAVGSLLAAAAGRFSERAIAEGVQLHSASGATVVLVDRLQIELVLRNLLANAFDAIANEPQGKRRIDIAIEDDGIGNVSIAVIDSGPGLSASAASELFEPFASTKASGLGLGLVISRAIIEAHGGLLSAEPGPRGIFRFTLPVAVSEPADAKP